VTDAIVTGRVDAGVLPEPMLSAAKDRTRSIGSGDDAIGAHTVQTVWYALRSWLENNKDAARRFAAAIYAPAIGPRESGESGRRAAQVYLDQRTTRLRPLFNETGSRRMQAVFDAGQVQVSAAGLCGRLRLGRELTTSRRQSCRRAHPLPCRPSRRPARQKQTRDRRVV